MCLEVDKIYNVDCLEGLSKLKEKSIDCIITSPPYNVGKKYNQYEDKKDYSEYLNFMKEVFLGSKRVLKEDGRLCVNIGDGKNGKIPTHSDFIQMCVDIGFLVMSTIIWNKNTTSKRTAWGSFMSPSSPSFPRCFEYILIFSKSEKLKRKGEVTISKEDFIKWTNGMWVFQPETKNIIHPAAFPLELPKRLIQLLTYKEDVILDPFIGSGTTAVAALMCDRHYIGFEMDKVYYEVAVKRLEDVKINLDK